jgi:hypothetical protein
MVLEQVLEYAEELSLEDKQIFIEILSHRLTEKQRNLIYQDFQDDLKDYKEGNFKSGSPSDLFKSIK